MFEVSPFRAYTVVQSITPLIHCSVNNVLIKTTPLFNQSVLSDGRRHGSGSGRSEEVVSVTEICDSSLKELNIS